MKSLGRALFSVYFWLAAFGWMFLTIVATCVALIFLPYRKVHNRISGWGFSKILRLGFTRIRVHYDEDFDPQRPSVFCQNHVNILDAFIAVEAIPHAFCGLMHAWQFKIPIYGWMMKLSRGIPVEVRSKRNLEFMRQEALKRNEEGLSVLTFPEGHRTLDGKVKTFRKGAFFMARDAQYPIVPIAVKGNFKINRKGSFTFTPGQTIEVWVGKQTELTGIQDAEMEGIARNTEQWIRDRIEAEAA